MVYTRARKLFGIGEWLTLLGMIVAVLGAGMAWPNPLPPAAVAAATASAAAYVSVRPHVALGFDLRVGWLNVGWTVVACAVICGALLLWEPAGGMRRLLVAVQVALGLTILALAALHLGLATGVIMAMAGALLLLGGAAARCGKESS